VRQYKSGVPRNLREIGKQLGVTHILEGSVQRAGDRLRIAAQLIDARTDSQIWAETYDRTAADLFTIQSELAESIVAQLQTKLSPEQKADIEVRPTQDLVAFELYLRAKQIMDSYLIAEDVRAALLSALQSLDQAIKRDPNFVSAYCYIARANDLLYFFDLDPTPDRILLAEAAVKAALRLRPDSAEAHFAMADFLFRCHRDYDGALKELAIARPGLPVTSTGAATIGLKRNEISQKRSRSIRETPMPTTCSQIPTTCNAGICSRRRFTTACWLPASARQLYFFEGPPPFSTEQEIQQSCAMCWPIIRTWI
jgi:tetratricopeptide (TPR) repeat protein